MKIKSCPLCASPAKTQKFALVFWLMRCTGCMLKLKDMHTSEEAVIKAWNTRLTDQDRRNRGKRWHSRDYFEVVNDNNGEVLARFREYEGDNDERDNHNVVHILTEYGFNWGHLEFAKRTGRDQSYSGRHSIPTALRFYEEV